MEQLPCDHVLKCTCYYKYVKVIFSHIASIGILEHLKMTHASNLNAIAYGNKNCQALVDWGEGMHPKKQTYDYLIDLKFSIRNYGHGAIQDAKFQVVNCSIFGDTASSK